MRVLVVDESEERTELLRDGLRQAGCEVTASLSSPFALLESVKNERPDVIVIDTDSPSRDVLEHIVMVTQHTPRPASTAPQKHQRRDMFQRLNYS